MPALRRPRRRETAAVPSDLEAAERRITELYKEAVEQLGSDQAPVRSGGMYALERLAQDNPAHRQTIVNAICAYLRMPFPGTAPASNPGPEVPEGRNEPGTESETQTDGIGRTWQQERQVRLNAQRILTKHLCDDRAKKERSTHPPSSRFWNNICLDLTGATLIDFNLVNGVLADANFDKAAFSGDARFGGAAFRGAAWFGEATFHGAAWFGGAAFSGAAWFGGAAFSGSADFAEADFVGDALFGEVAFGGDAGFHRTAFGGVAEFGGAAFGSNARFDKATFGGVAAYGGAIFGGDARFDKATFSRGASFDEATFTGDAWYSEVSFGGLTDFGEATFARDARFDQATFGGGASFDEVAFGGGAWFRQATFGRGAWFGDATFGGADTQHFEQARILSPGASHVWPTGWRLADADGSGYTVARADDER